MARKDKAPRPRESAIVGSIKRVLAERSAWHIKTHGASMQVSGIPDIIACYRGRFVGLEVKDHKGNPTPLQKYELECIATAGGVSAVVRSVEEVETMLDNIDQEIDHVSPAP